MFDLQSQNNYNLFLERINNLSENSAAKWGKMDVSQMLAHCSIAFEASLGELELKRGFLSYLIGGFMKGMATSSKPFSRNSPTHEKLVVTVPHNFDAEKSRLINLLNRFHQAGLQGITKKPHAFFGRLTPEQWNLNMGKHLDHHLQQFGV